MSVATKVQDYLNNQHARYDVLHHAYSEGAIQTAIAAQVPLKSMAKAVVMEDHEGRHLMAVLPANNKVQIKKLGEIFQRGFRLAKEDSIKELFGDCQRGAIPAVGPAYQMETVVDDSLMESSDLYMEAGDHEDLIHMSGEQFSDVMRDCRHAEFSVSIASDSPYHHDW